MADRPVFDILRPLDKGRPHDSEQAKDRLLRRQIPHQRKDTEAAARYQVDKPLTTAINMALSVGAPLLLTGEPGTGKTQVAYHLAWYFDIPLYEYVVRSSSTAEDLKFEFDAVGYLRTAYEQALTKDPSASEEPVDREAFLTEKALWQAYQNESDCVLLIDEIDKAPRDFPNDLLLELDKHRFPHPFRPGPENDIAAPEARPPIVIITSNAERRLPDAFLRRCIYHHIELTEDLVRKAVSACAEVGEFPRLNEPLRERAIRRFMEIRKNDLLRKTPSTGEVLVWLTLLSARGVTEVELGEDVTDRELPAITALVKDRDDLDHL